MDRETLLDLIPAYTLGALDPEERAEFEAWLATDAEARRLLAEYQAVADSLVMMTPVRQAPGHLEADLRRRLAESRTRRAWFWRPLAAATALALVAGVVLVLALLLNQSVDPAKLYAELSQGQDVRRVALAPSEGQDQLAGEFVSDGSRAVIQVWQLPVISDDQTFEVWLIDEDGAQSGGLVEAAPSGEPTYILVPLDKPLEEYQAFGVSIEPDGGSPEPDPRPARLRRVAVVVDAGFFVSVGAVNPWLTIIANALRVADNLRHSVRSLNRVPWSAPILFLLTIPAASKPAVTSRDG